jgi:protein-S-isoprenylcysteine O-methyltransferase Ste14
VLFLKISFTAIFAFFIFIISDFRNKAINPLFQQGWLIFMRTAYLIPLLCCLFFLWNLKTITILDCISLFLLIVGTLIVVASKKELGKRHSWAGYAAKEIDDFCISGIYAWIRHPIYLGIMVADIGIAFLIIPNFQINDQLAITFLIGSLITFIFLVISSVKETKFLTDKFGKPFTNYARRVYAFFPFRKFNETMDGDR